MSKMKNKLPKKCRDRNQAFSWHNGKRIYHGIWGSPEADKSYKRFIAALLETPIPSTLLTRDSVESFLITELCDAFLEHIEARNTHKTDVQHFKTIIGHLVKSYGELPVNEFSPKKLKAVRDQMIKSGTLCRDMINKYVSKIRSIFQWGIGEEIVNPTIEYALRAVKALRKGEQGTFDHPEREAVPGGVIAATLPFLTQTVAAMVQVQYLTGARPSEICDMRVGNIDQNRKNGLWYYVPESHKTEDHIGAKPIPLGKPEQELIAPYLEGKNPSDPVFSPRTSAKERAAEIRTNRISNHTPLQREGYARIVEQKIEKVPEFFDAASYRRAVRYAIEKGNRNGVKIPHWFPYLLRNAAATAIELEHGLDEAQAQLGHTSANMTKRYSSAQLKQREKLAKKRRNPFKENGTEE